MTPSSSTLVFHTGHRQQRLKFEKITQDYIFGRNFADIVQEVAEILNYEYYLCFLLDSTGLSPAHGEFWGFFCCLRCSLKVLQVVLSVPF